MTILKNKRLKPSSIKFKIDKFVSSHKKLTLATLRSVRSKFVPDRVESFDVYNPNIKILVRNNLNHSRSMIIPIICTDIIDFYARRWYLEWILAMRLGMKKFKNREQFKSIVQYFYRRGLSNTAHKMLTTILFSMYFSKKSLTYRPIKMMGGFFRKILNTIDSFNIPFKFVPRFIKHRIRKIPAYATKYYQRARTWRSLAVISKNTTHKASSVVSAELHKLYKHDINNSLLTTRLPQICKDGYKYRVYIRRKHRAPQKLFDYFKKNTKELLNLIWQTKGIAIPKKKSRRWRFVVIYSADSARSVPRLPIYVAKRLKRWKFRAYKNYNFSSMLFNFFKVLYGYSRNPQIIRHA